jgi:pilus assembly protein CpaE
VIAVFSGKGGSGKTSIATNLAAALAMDTHAKQKVALVDLDLLLGDVAVLLDLVPERTIADLMPVLDKLDPELLRGYLSVHSSGIKVLPAPLRPEEAEIAGVPLVRKVIDVLSRTYDYVVLDLPRTLDDWVVVALDAANLVMLVTTFELGCLKSTKVCLDLMRRWRYSEDKLKLVINHANRVRGGGFSIGEAEAALDYPIFWKIPSESGGLPTSNPGLTIVQSQPSGRLAQNFRELAGAVGGANQHRRGLIPRMVPAPAMAALRLH